jgi:hypothetical protein
MTTTRVITITTSSLVISNLLRCCILSLQSLVMARVGSHCTFLYKSIKSNSN